MKTRTLKEKIEGRIARLNNRYAVADRLGMDKPKIIRRCQALTSEWRKLKAES